MEAREPVSLEDLHLEHPGLSIEGSVMYARAAAVMLAVRHASPCVCEVQSGGEGTSMMIAWQEPSAGDHRFLANSIDRTEAGAYSLGLAAAGERLDYVALRRVAHGLGADWYLVPRGANIPDDPDLDLDRADLVRLEVSGIAAETDSEMRRRLMEKMDQLREAGIPGPGWAAVVGFTLPRVWIDELEV